MISRMQQVHRRVYSNLNMMRLRSSTITSQNNLYHTSPILKDEQTEDDEVLSNNNNAAIKQKQKQAAINYNNRRSAYEKSVSQLRTQYASEIEQQRKADQQQQSQQRAQMKRKRLERQRNKNIQIVKNALKQEQDRQAMLARKQKRLEISEQKMMETKRLLEKSRKLVVQELEEEAVDWMASPEEVDAVFDSVENQQKLWARPGGFVGAAAPCEDSELWRYDSHTWDMSRTYPTPRELLLEELEKELYYDNNMDKKYWTEERILAQQELEEKAKLRAIVREEGRKALLLKQRTLMQDVFTEERSMDEAAGKPSLPKPMPAPSLDFLANEEAMEMEGVKVMKEDPGKIFIFDSETSSSSSSEDGVVSQASLGKPIGLRDRVRSSPGGTPYPRTIGREAPPDTRSERQKKQDEREQRMWAAAKAEQAAGVEFAAEDGLDDGSDPVDYDEVGNEGDDFDEEWEKGLDPELDKDLLDTPSHERYSEEDIDWIIEQLEKKKQVIIEEMKVEEEEMKRLELLKKVGQQEGDDDDDDDDDDTEGQGVKRTTGIDEKGREYTEYDVDDEAIMAALDQSSATFDDIHNVIDTLSPEQIEALEALDEEGGDGGEMLDAEQIKAALSKVPGLSDEQIQSLVDLEMSLSKNDDLREKLNK